MSSVKRRILIDLVIKRDGTTCTWCCRETIDLPVEPNHDCSRHMTLEHVLPVCCGGTHQLSNLAIACFMCNNKRGSRPIEYLPDLGVMLLDMNGTDVTREAG